MALCNDCNEGYKNRCSYEQIQVLSGKSKKDSEICLLLDRSIEIDDLYLGKRKKNKLLLFLAFWSLLLIFSELSILRMGTGRFAIVVRWTLFNQIFLLSLRNIAKKVFRGQNRLDNSLLTIYFMRFRLIVIPPIAVVSWNNKKINDCCS